VNLAEFRLNETRDLRRPRSLFASSLTDPRKGLVLLLRAFNIVHRRCPQAILQLAGPAELAGADPQTALAWIWQLLDQEAHSSVELSGVGTLQDLPGLYQAAAVTVLPSIEEPFGMVLIESLACGTPVVATASSGPRDIVTPEVGRLVAEVPDLQSFFDDQRAQELADALLAAIDLAGTPGNAAACRARAGNWDVQVIGAQVEQWYREVHV
jgi:glycosyltransferase involved in cell wall biosynthesis